MLFNYVTVTGDTGILDRALPMAEKELTWWKENRQIRVQSSYTKRAYDVYHYAVKNTAPRPEVSRA